MFDPSSFANPTPLAHADTSRDVLPRGGTSQKAPIFARWSTNSLPVTPVFKDPVQEICLEYSDRLCSSFLQSRMLEEVRGEFEFTAKIAAFELQETTALSYHASLGAPRSLRNVALWFKNVNEQSIRKEREMGICVRSLLEEIETDRTRVESDEIMDIDSDREKVNLRKGMNMKRLN
ncbi:hypothetical protein TNCV_1031201 [Trichonephila clavipes]|nr:hypothetical protein TNCV_1031201 [Trichonephila clavipes]